MAKTGSDVIDRALRILNVLGAGQPASAEDTARFDLNSSADYLNGIRVVDLRQAIAADDIPPEVFEPFAMFIAARHGVIFGAPMSDMVAFETKALRDIALVYPRIKPAIVAAFDRMKR